MIFSPVILIIWGCSGKIVDRLSNPAIVALTDRNDVDDQLFDTVAASVQLLGQEPKQAENRKDLKTLLKVASGGIVFFHHAKVHAR